jgi:hypothetical protein
MRNDIEKYEFHKLTSNVQGLKWIPTIGISLDNRDYIDNFAKNMQVPVEFSKRNQDKLIDYFQSIKENCKCIVEIGVFRNEYSKTSTSVLIDNKLESTFYFGIDINDKSELNNSNKNIYTIKTNSINHDILWKKMAEFNLNSIDFLFIDGYHSIDMVVNDWKYTEKLSKNGIVGFHDTNVHAGPYFVFNAIDENLFEKFSYFTDNADDWGISFAIKK